VLVVAVLLSYVAFAVPGTASCSVHRNVSRYRCCHWAAETPRPAAVGDRERRWRAVRRESQCTDGSCSGSPDACDHPGVTFKMLNLRVPTLTSVVERLGWTATRVNRCRRSQSDILAAAQAAGTFNVPAGRGENVYHHGSASRRIALTDRLASRRRPTYRFKQSRRDTVSGGSLGYLSLKSRHNQPWYFVGALARARKARWSPASSVEAVWWRTTALSWDAPAASARVALSGSQTAERPKARRKRLLAQALHVELAGEAPGHGAGGGCTCARGAKNAKWTVWWRDGSTAENFGVLEVGNASNNTAALLTAATAAAGAASGSACRRKTTKPRSWRLWGLGWNPGTIACYATRQLTATAASAASGSACNVVSQVKSENTSWCRGSFRSTSS